MAELCQASALELINMHVGGVIVTLPCQLRALALELNSPSTASPLGKKWSFLNVAPSSASTSTLTLAEVSFNLHFSSHPHTYLTKKSIKAPTSLELT